MLPKRDSTVVYFGPVFPQDERRPPNIAQVLRNKPARLSLQHIPYEEEASKMHSGMGSESKEAKGESRPIKKGCPRQTKQKIKASNMILSVLLRSET